MQAPEKTALRKLIEAVEAGESFGIIPLGQKAIGPDDYSYRQGDLVCNAYNGSLDAAKELHEALLPDRATVEFWHSKRYEDESYVYVHMPDAVYSGRADNPARAWLIAILKAYEAQQ